MAVRDSAQDAGGRPWRRQFASWHRAGNALIGFGGYDGRRIGSVVVVDDDGSEAVVHEGCGADPDAVVPPPLLHHRATVRGRTLVVLGGRTWPGAPFHGLHVLDLDTWRWRSSPDPNDDDDDGPAPRYRFALAHDPLGDRLFMQGGIGAGACLVDDSLWELDLGADPAGRRWRRLPDADRDDNRARRRPGRRHSHTMTFVDGRLYVLGGLTRPGAARPTDARLYCYDLGAAHRTVSRLGDARSQAGRAGPRPTWRRVRRRLRSMGTWPLSSATRSWSWVASRRAPTPSPICSCCEHGA